MIRVPQKLHEFTIWNTAKCNLRCKYCFVYKLYENQPNRSMTRETADALIHFASHHLMENGSFWFFGGEPLADFDILKYIVEKVRANGYNWRFGLTSNCTLITEERVKWMKQFDFGILCSIDGTKELHNRYRVYPDGRGSWDEAWRGVNLVKKHLVPIPQIRWTFTPDTVEGLTESIKWFVDRGFYNLAVDAVYEVEWNEESLRRLRKELEKLKLYLVKWYSEGKPVFSMFVRDAVHARVAKSRNWMSRCGLGMGSIGIDINGDLYPCHRFVSSRVIKIGDVYSGFSSERLRWIREWQLCPPYCEKPSKCLDCKFRLACSGGCLAVNYDLFGDPHIVPESMCDIKNLCVEVLGDLVDLLQDNPTFRKLYLGSERERRVV